MDLEQRVEEAKKRLAEGQWDSFVKDKACCTEHLAKHSYAAGFSAGLEIGKLAGSIEANKRWANLGGCGMEVYRHLFVNEWRQLSLRLDALLGESPKEGVKAP